MERRPAVEAAARSLRRVIVNTMLSNARVADAIGLSPSDGQFLHLLELNGPLTPGSLSRLTGFSTGAVTGVVDRLVRKGFVRRERDAADRRKVLVILDADKAVTELAPLYADHGRPFAAVLAGYDPAELALISGFLAQVAQAEPAAADA
ncbi:MarR family winged helix-turn-helix transcriptional regulator [Streptosporangium sp. CA-135522]|uniref:MarR family winged helix-turn-helix transcriptional regulator n=1 Tax=Streptosporangium sp. CA-135522 TaxID=3240072 RepID=UPI003D9175D5